MGSAFLFGGSYEGNGYTNNLYVGKGGTLDTGLYTGLIGNLTFDQGGLLLIDGASFGALNRVNIDGKIDLTGAIIRFGFDPSILLLTASPRTFSTLTFASALNEFNFSQLFNFGEAGGFATANWWEGVEEIWISDTIVFQGGELVIDEYFNNGSTWQLVLTAGQVYIPTEDNSTPEPATILILGLGIIGLGLARRRR